MKKYSQMSPLERRQTREMFAELQGGKCWYCWHPLNKKPPKRILDKEINWSLFPPNFLKYPIHLQHDHDTDLPEGTVHAYCNAVLWQYEGR